MTELAVPRRARPVVVCPPRGGPVRFLMSEVLLYSPRSPFSRSLHKAILSTIVRSAWPRVWGLRSGVWGLGFEVCGLGFGVWGVGFGVWGVGCGCGV